jgi:thiamine pyrophosphokinase
MRIAIIANGVINDYTATREKLADVDYFIACDGGLRHFPLLGLTPDTIIGDFDSAPTGLLEGYRLRGVPVIPFPKEKDETDLALAVSYALPLNPSFIVIIGALGGRIDHTLANFHVLAQTGNTPAEIWDEKTKVLLIKDRIAFTIFIKEYFTISLIPLTSEVRGITTRGLLYPLSEETLCAGEVRGVSNEFISDFIEITVKSGLLLAILNK